MILPVEMAVMSITFTHQAVGFGGEEGWRFGFFQENTTMGSTTSPTC